jgi:hypothetical protein
VLGAFANLSPQRFPGAIGRIFHSLHATACCQEFYAPPLCKSGKALSAFQMDGTKPMPSAAESDASGARETAKRPRDDAAAAADDAKRPRADDDAPALAADAAAPDAAQDVAPDAQDAATRQNLEARYVGLAFIDDDAAGEGAREIVRIEKASNEWTAVAAQLTNKENEQPYLVNESLDAMVDAYRCRGDARHETCACPPPRGHTIEVLWEVHDEETDESRDVWWRAVVGEEDGTGHALDNGDVVLRKYRIEYVARPELSEPAPAAYDVCFLSPRALLDCSGDVVMQWRSFGSSDLCGNQPVR